jgi:hypothetical protein
MVMVEGELVRLRREGCFDGRRPSELREVDAGLGK